MKIRMTRTFANVGQGLFAIEKFYDGEQVVFCAVYDCGSGSGKQINGKNKLIINENLGDEKISIDVLFISHFDSDHVNGIPYILDHYMVKNIFLPLIPDDVKVLLASWIMNKKEWYRRAEFSLLVRPKKFIEQYSKNIRPRIFFVRDEDSDSDVVDRGELISYGENILYTIKKCPIIIDAKNNKDLYNWEYRLYNLNTNKYQEYLNKLKNLTNRNLFLNEMLRETKCSKAFGKRFNDKELKDFICDLFDNLGKLGEHVKKYENIFFTEFYRRFIKHCDKCIASVASKNNSKPSNNNTDGDENILNINSLVVYSGPIEVDCKVDNGCLEQICDGINELYNCLKVKYNRINLHKILCTRNMIKNAGCLFCGDVNGKEASFKQILSKHKSKLMCMQVPHHGSKHNNDVDTLKENIYYVICAGENNRYGHPSASVIAMLMTKTKIYRIVTESEKSKLNFEYILG